MAVKATQQRDGTYSSGGGSSDELPLVLVRRAGTEVLERARALLDARRRDERHTLDSDLEDWDVELRSMRIEVYDLGVAVSNGTFAVVFPKPVVLGKAVRDLKRIVSLRADGEQAGSPIPGVFRKLSAETTHQFRASVDSTGRRRIQQSWLNLDPLAREMPLKLVHLHRAYYALYMEIDRGLLTLLDRTLSGTIRTPLSELEDGANSVFEDSIPVMKARARVDSALASLGGDEQAIWNVVADVQKFGALAGGVDRTVDALQRIAECRLQQATSATHRRIARILGSLTALAVVTLATTSSPTSTAASPTN